jgi:hypothetical protein
MEIRAPIKTDLPVSNVGGSFYFRAGDVKLDVNDSVNRGAVMLLGPGGSGLEDHGNFYVETAGRATLEMNMSRAEQAIFYGNTFCIYEARSTQADEYGRRGSVRWDENYLYVCTETNSWKRIPLEVFADPEV